MWFTIHGSYRYDMCWRPLGLNIFCVALFWGVLEMVDMFFKNHWVFSSIISEAKTKVELLKRHNYLVT